MRQIRFNAWHYSDSNLWASLAVEIFERLADPEPVDAEEYADWVRGHGDNRRAEREKLLQQLESFHEAKAELDAELERLKQERRAVEAQYLAATRERSFTIAESSPSDVLRELSQRAEIEEARERIASELEIGPAVGEWKELAEELRSTSGHAAHVWRLIANRGWVLFALAIVITAIGATPVLLLSLDGVAAWLSRIVAAAATLGALATTLLAFVKPAAGRVNEGLRLLEEGIRSADEIEGSLRERHERAERELEARLRDADSAIDVLRQRQVQIETQIATVMERRHHLSAGRQLYDFLSRRAADYRAQQGLVGMLHRDFRLLDSLLQRLSTEATEASEAGEAGEGARPPSMSTLPAISRVVLYIDDLDRCPPDKVLQVLQAVHLLLALPRFVVVVGVDPRWLSRSLRHEYRYLAEAGAVDELDADQYLRLLPTEYLEKIFQIPLRLPPMEPGSYRRLIDGLTVEDDPGAEERSVDRDRDRSDDERAVMEGTQATERETEASAALLVSFVEDEPERAAGEIERAAIKLTDPELEFVRHLGGLVSTPRAAKRMLNTYRLVRATRRRQEVAAFLGDRSEPGDYYVALSLLAVAAGFPGEANDVLQALLRAGQEPAAEQPSWSGFVERLAPRAGSEPGTVATAATEEIAGDLAKWQRLHRGLAATLTANPQGDLSRYADWSPKVQRFSFML